jgi:adenine-specific DNA-methyltransferase
MPTLHWVGKDKVINHHHDVPFRLLDKKYSFEAKADRPANSSGNRIIHGDNLEALKSLLPEFEGKIKCIYIDPPYNTGNEKWAYNDAVNDPKIKKWLGKVVGKADEDFSRHDKWLCMMYPRLKLLHRLLADDGVIFISIDDNELANLQALMREIFGTANEIACIVWEKGKKGDSKLISVTHEYIVAFAKSKSLLTERGINWRRRKAGIDDVLSHYNTLCTEIGEDYPKIRKSMMAWYRGLPKGDPRKSHKHYNYADERGLYFPDNFHGPDDGRLNRPRYTIYHPITGKACAIPSTGWRWEESTTNAALLEAPPRIHFGKDHTTIPNRKSYLFETDVEPMFSVFYTDGRAATLEVESILGTGVFQFPKDSNVIANLVSMVAKTDDIVLDSFAGSGTTAHSVLKLNTQDGGNRKFILIETMDYAETITAERVRRVIDGYGEGKKAVDGTGGSFDFYTVGAPLFLEDNNLNESVGSQAIREYVAYTEGIPLAVPTSADSKISPYMLGRNGDSVWLFYYDPSKATTLSTEFLAELNIKAANKRPVNFIVYADKCSLDEKFMRKHGITFKRIPRDITKF